MLDPIEALQWAPDCVCVLHVHSHAHSTTTVYRHDVTRTRTHTHTHTHTHIHTHTYTRTHARTHTHTWCRGYPTRTSALPHGGTQNPPKSRHGVANKSVPSTVTRQTPQGKLALNRPTIHTIRMHARTYLKFFVRFDGYITVEVPGLKEAHGIPHFKRSAVAASSTQIHRSQKILYNLTNGNGKSEGEWKRKVYLALMGDIEQGLRRHSPPLDRETKYLSPCLLRSSPMRRHPCRLKTSRPASAEAVCGQHTYLSFIRP